MLLVIGVILMAGGGLWCAANSLEHSVFSDNEDDSPAVWIDDENGASRPVSRSEFLSNLVGLAIMAIGALIFMAGQSAKS